jgi:hypothetical protein
VLVERVLEEPAEARVDEVPGRVGVDREDRERFEQDRLRLGEETRALGLERRPRAPDRRVEPRIPPAGAVVLAPVSKISRKPSGSASSAIQEERETS